MLVVQRVQHQLCIYFWLVWERHFRITLNTFLVIRTGET